MRHLEFQCQTLGKTLVQSKPAKVDKIITETDMLTKENDFLLYAEQAKVFSIQPTYELSVGFV